MSEGSEAMGYEIGRQKSKWWPRLTCSVLMLAAVLTSLAALVSQPRVVASPDLNNNGVVNVVDMQGVVNTILGFGSPAGANPDVNGDGKVNVSDVQRQVNESLHLPRPVMAWHPRATAATATQAFSVQLLASGGATPYAWSASGLPPGLAVSNAGLISGTPMQAGSFQATLTVSDASSEQHSRQASFVVAAAPPDTVQPVVSFSAPAALATVSGSVSVEVAASDNVGVTSVEIRINSALVSTLTAAPYNYSWNTTFVPNGTTTIEAKAFDAAANSATASLTVTVANQVPPTASRVVMAYAENIWGSGGATAISSFDYSTITHVIHGFVLPDANGGRKSTRR